MSLDTTFPTILIAECNFELRSRLTRAFRQQGYLVLEAENSTQALDFAKIHSRHIHVMLAGGSDEGRALAATIKQYRPRMSVLFINEDRNHQTPGFLPPELAVGKVRELVAPPKTTRTAKA